MWRFIFCVAGVAALAAPTSAQRVPGRDLLEFPIGSLAEAPVLATLARDGIWNPAATVLSDSQAFRLIASALDGPRDLAFSAQLFGGAYRAPGTPTISLSVLRAYVSGIPRTEGDPQSVGSDIRYGTTLISGAVARRIHASIDAGIALRYQLGELDAESRGAIGLDGGIILHDIGLQDLRIGASSFLFRPGRGHSDETRLSIGADVRVAGSRGEREVRLGYSYASTPSLARDHYLFTTAKFAPLQVDAGLLVSQVHTRANTRYRVGVVLLSSTVRVGLAREDNPSGLAPTYQVVVSTYVHR